MITQAEPVVEIAQRHHRRIGTMVRYTAGSGVATVISQIAFVLAFRLFAAGPTIATVVAFLAGALPNYMLNKRWAWREKGRGSRADLVRYVAVIAVTTGAAIVTTRLADDLVRARVSSSDLRTLLVDLVYLATYGVMFVLKYVLFDGMVFNRRSRPTASEEPARSPSD